MAAAIRAETAACSHEPVSSRERVCEKKGLNYNRYDEKSALMLCSVAYKRGNYFK
jgi:hypothetical protein